MDRQTGSLNSRRWLASSLCVLAAFIGCTAKPTVDEKSEPTIEVSEDQTALADHRRMLKELERIGQEAPDRDPYLGDANVRTLRAQLASLPPHGSLTQRLRVLLNLGAAELAIGNEQESIDRLQEAYQMLPALLEHGLDRKSANTVTYQLAVAYMRLGETQNCCQRNSPESCILPIQGEGIHTNPTGSRTAIRYLNEVLDSTAPASDEHLRARWLSNIAYMTLGEYPGEVPEYQRIPPEAFRSTEEFPRFANVASQLGLDTFSLSGGVVVEDMDGDADLDLVVSTWDVAGQIRYFRNDGKGNFRDATNEAGLTGIFGGLNMVHADYDNDGDFDVYVLRGAWLFESGRHPNSLLQNDGTGRFTDVTFGAGLGQAYFPTQTAAWADYDNDGDLDLYVGNESTPKQTSPSQLFRNEGDGTFTDVAKAAGVTNMRFAKSVAWGDYDADRFPDLYVSNLSDANRLYRNNGDGTFSDLAVSLDVTEPLPSFPCWFWDVDNDGNMDIFVSAYATNIGNLAGAYLGLPVDSQRLARLYLGNGTGGFEEVGAQWGLKRPMAPMGSNFGDVDGDGFLDFYLGTGDPLIEAIMPNAMFRNVAGTGFADVTTAGGFGHLQKGHAIVFADFDHDGDQDIFEQMGGAYLGDGFYDALYENPGFDHRWLTIRLEGVESNRAAIGARIRVEIVEDGQIRSVFRHVNTGGSFGSNSLRQTIGLGRAEGTAKVEVYWPTSDTTQVFEGVALDSAIRIQEGAKHFQPLELKSFKLGGN
ncbi:MAG: CRTAC1 family protein [Bythopirellula sp.]